MVSFFFGTFSIFIAFVTFANSQRHYLLNTLNATSELGWAVYSSLNNDGWLEETYRSETKNLNHQAFSTCVVEHQNFENWLLLPRIERGQGGRLFFEIKFTMRKCNDIPNQVSKAICKETLKLYAHPVNSATLLPAHNWHNSTDWRLVETLAPNEDDRQVFFQTASYAFEQSSIYFAIKDAGSCSSVLYVKIYYEICPSSTDTLTKLPRTIPNPDIHAVLTVNGECIGNSSLSSNRGETPKGLCKADGTWQMLTEECQCNPGYIYSRSANTCAPCGLNSYKKEHGAAECHPCPANSHADKLGSTYCACLPGFYRTTNSKRDDCVLQPTTSPYQNIIVEENTAASDESVFPTQTTQKSSKSDLTMGKNMFFVICLVLVIATAIMFGLILFFFKGTCKSEKHSDLDALDTYKQGTITPDYGQSNKSVFSGGTFKRKLNVPLIPAYQNNNGLGKPFKPYVDPTTYANHNDALAEFTNEIPVENVEVTRTIGAGEFGEVCSGRLKVENVYGGVVQQIVAVKTLLPGSSDKAKADFLAEASIMGQFEHENVIRLVGVVTKSEPVMILTEYMLNGSLDKFLRFNDNGSLTVLQLVQMMHGVSCGMKYLTDKGFVHRDLAARNVLVDDRLTCKIADFGLSRGVDMFDTQEYTTQGGKIPIRWTAPEAISHHKYTAASDVWSFGIVMWEICSFGERPYWDWTNHKVIQEIQNGFRLPVPMHCPTFLHNIMMECWQPERHQRPPFDQLVQRLAHIIRNMEGNQIEHNEMTFAAPFVPTPPASAPPILTMASFLRLNELSHYTEVLHRNGINALDQLGAKTYIDLVKMGVHEADARRLQQSLNAHRMSNFDLNVPYHGVGFGTLQHSRSPLLSCSSVGTNHTTLTNSPHGSAGSTKSGTARREEGFLV